MNTQGFPTRRLNEFRSLRVKHPDFTETGFYEPETLSVEYLIRSLDSLPDDIVEFVLHPGFYDKNIDSSYREEREQQLRVLTDPELSKHLQKKDYYSVAYDEI